MKDTGKGLVEALFQEHAINVVLQYNIGGTTLPHKHMKQENKQPHGILNPRQTCGALFISISHQFF